MMKMLAQMVMKFSLIKRNLESSTKDILDSKNFLDLIELERDRVHRTNWQFSLVLISVNGHHNGNAVISQITGKILKRVRRIDRVGWYDAAHLGILLANASSSGAQVVVNDIGLNSAVTREDIDVVIISYP